MRAGGARTAAEEVPSALPAVGWGGAALSGKSARPLPRGGLPGKVPGGLGGSGETGT